MASSGVMRFSGSQCKQRATKSRKSASLHRRACASVFEPGRRFLPRELGIMRGFPLESVQCNVLVFFFFLLLLLWFFFAIYLPKKSFLRALCSIRYRLGMPRISMIHASCSCSFSPGNNGSPVYNSAKIQPRLHMSIAIL